jgi:hypothetical protein
VAFPSRSQAGGPGSSAGLAPNTAEETAFVGWPLLVLAVLGVVWLGRRIEVRILVLTAVAGGLFAMGTTWAWSPNRSTIPAPFGLVDDIPPFEAVVPARFALISTAALGVLLALTADRLTTGPTRPVVRAAGCLVLLAVLLPIVSAGPLGTTPHPLVPRFITSGDWRQYVSGAARWSRCRSTARTRSAGAGCRLRRRRNAGILHRAHLGDRPARPLGCLTAADQRDP